MQHCLWFGGTTINCQHASILTPMFFSYLCLVLLSIVRIFKSKSKLTFVFHPIRLSLSFQPVGIFSDPDSITWTHPSNAEKEPENSVLRIAFLRIPFQTFWELPISPCSVIRSTSPSLRWLYKFCNLSQRLADSRAQLGVPNYQKPDLNDNVCERAKHGPARGLTVHPFQFYLNLI